MVVFAVWGEPRLNTQRRFTICDRLRCGGSAVSASASVRLQPLIVSEMTARCWRLIAAVAALVHAPAARLAMLRKRLRGDPFMLVLLSAVNGCRGETFRRKATHLGPVRP